MGGGKYEKPFLFIIFISFFSLNPGLYFDLHIFLFQNENTYLCIKAITVHVFLVQTSTIEVEILVRTRAENTAEDAGCNGETGQKAERGQTNTGKDQ